MGEFFHFCLEQQAKMLNIDQHQIDPIYSLDCYLKATVLSAFSNVGVYVQGLVTRFTSISFDITLSSPEIALHMGNTHFHYVF